MLNIIDTGVWSLVTGDLGSSDAYDMATFIPISASLHESVTWSSTAKSEEKLERTTPVASLQQTICACSRG
jgi:hypothetical protein